ncbi:phosphatidylinositol mannoside acyltransferase [Actinomadura craniellae]|uniref:Phosphatidylinositol mannoside acyltransferase n=1 Tax=Actinomadura craniellae TaxID=2231787 RepID=A0A365HDU5_9ACTN|nr:phosphatidylinositol mannoside acyltransferase [Actinomadura craniellae]RAY17202.1 phosphatidylinositol mannoside acyltransferase [Actinomadura craniellae]
MTLRPPSRDEATDALYALGWTVVRKMPERAARQVFMAIADRTWRRRGAGVRQLEKNLCRVLGKDAVDAEVRALSRRSMRSYLRYWLEVFRLPEMSRERVLAGMRITGHEALFEALDSGRGAVVALPHMGNYEQAGAWLVYQGYPFTTVAERLRPESLFDRFVAFRESLGMEVLALGGGNGATVFGTLARRLRAGGCVCIVADRDLTESGLEVEFFGRPARMPGGAAALAAQTGAALFPATLWYEGEHWGARVHEEIPVPAEGTRQEKARAMTQGVADAFAAGIVAHPEDWHMLQRVWLEDL